ncbi:MAG: hypothetical protein BGO55_01515 [Sphingobacteriales bacterium 50-39]|nr:hypothetical protein [Sphingobacteriales bacterium]OJW53784.1 MAG: hypothetical protein BGO55_01515 [Sphingobacteriales bacterium 50-39]
MNYVVFYSWQSDLENKLNRSFIHDALEKAARHISKTEAFSLEAVIDRDTYGIPGSPSIVESITGKIAKSDVFVCDVSIINSNSKGRQTPNPNVIFELGYASSILGWDRIIMVQNAAFGGPDLLPFDLRGRRVLQYYIDEAIEHKSEEKQKLKEGLIDTFHHALQYYSALRSIKEKKVIWWGNWDMDTITKVRGGHLHITRVSSDAFFFELMIFDGARTGHVIGKAQILTPNSAYARIQTTDDKECEIHFRRRLERDGWYMEIEEGPHCSYWHGVSTTFSGTYKHATESAAKWGYLDEIDLNEIGRLTGKYLPIFLQNFQRINSQMEDGFTVITTGVKGMYTIMESIVVLDKVGTVWCACLDSENKSVRYFTNAGNEMQAKPKAMEDWLGKFTDRTVIVSNGEPIQPNYSY